MGVGDEGLSLFTADDGDEDDDLSLGTKTSKALRSARRSLCRWGRPFELPPKVYASAKLEGRDVGGGGEADCSFLVMTMLPSAQHDGPGVTKLCADDRNGLI